MPFSHFLISPYSVLLLSVHVLIQCFDIDCTRQSVFFTPIFYPYFSTEGALRVSLYQAFGQWEKVHRIQGNGAKSIAGSIKQKDLETGKRRSLLAFLRSLLFGLSCPGHVHSIFRLHSLIGCLPGLLTDPLLFVWFRLSFPGTFGIHVTLLDLSPLIIHQRFTADTEICYASLNAP